MRTKEQRNMIKLNAQNMHLSESLRSLEKKVKSRKLMCIKVCTWKIALCIGYGNTGCGVVKYGVQN